VPFAGYWGVAKPHQFPVYSHTASSNAKYGTYPSAMFYTHISDQYSPYFTQPISATVRDATHVIDGLLHHQTDLQIEEHYTDTAGYTDQ
jgi:TnpA family transposase